MLDPPAFTKSRETIQKAITAIKRSTCEDETNKARVFWLVRRAQAWYPPTILTDHRYGRERRKKKDQAGCFSAQSADHPIIRGIENTQYLKFLIVEVQ
jgi:23S rRNA (cytosine1962-C5)-methyltransferase